MASAARDRLREIAGPVAAEPRDRNQRHEKELLQVSNEETPTTEQPRALALAMRAGGRKKAAPKKKAAKKAAKKKAPAKKSVAKKAAKKAPTESADDGETTE